MDWNNKKEVLEAVNQNGYALKYAPDRLKNDKEVVLTAVRNKGMAFIFSSERLKNDKDVVLAAIEQEPFLVYQDIPKEMLRNKEIKRRLKESLKIVKHADKLEIGHKTINTLKIGEEYASRKSREIEEIKPFTKLGLAAGIVLGIGGLAAELGGLMSMGSNMSNMSVLIHAFGGAAAGCVGIGLFGSEIDNLDRDVDGLIDRAIINHYDKLSKLANKKIEMEGVLKKRDIKIEYVEDEIQ